MRIDLSSQGFQLKFFQSNLVFINLFDQTIDLIHHMPETSYQLSHFISGITVNCNFTASLIHLFHISGKLLDLSGEQCGKRHSQYDNDHNTKSDQRNLTDQHFGNRTLDHCWRLVKIICPPCLMAAAADIGIFFPQTVQHFSGFFLCGNITGCKVFSMINDILAVIYHKAAGIPFNNIGKRTEYFSIIQRNTENSFPRLPIVNFPDCCDLAVVPVHDPLNCHTVIQFVTPPFPLYFRERSQGIFMTHGNAFRKKLNPKNRFVIGFWHCKQRIHHFRILFIGSITVHVFILDHLLDLRGISKIIQKTGINLNLPVNIFPGLFQNGIHIFHLILPDKTAHTAVAVKRKNSHRYQRNHYKKNGQLVPVFHIVILLQKPLHPHCFLSCRIPGCFRNIPGSSGRNTKNWQILPSR